MKYCDLHSDALTNEGVLQVTKERLVAGGCLLQCFAAFIKEREGRFQRAIALSKKFEALTKNTGMKAVRRALEIDKERVNALLTLEGGGALEGDLTKLSALFERGYRMITLVWNTPNELGFPNCGKRGRERERGLTPFGYAVLEEAARLGILIDVSHASDRLFQNVYEWSRKNRVPFVASHSGAQSAFSHSRNLTNGQIRALSDVGGTVGLVFCADFLSNDKSAAGQREAILAHVRAIYRAGGEDVLSIGSDFDGTAENAYLKNPADMPVFLREIEREYGSRICEKMARENFLRVMKEVCG